MRGVEVVTEQAKLRVAKRLLSRDAAIKNLEQAVTSKPDMVNA
jgi:hypothetical protein